MFAPLEAALDFDVNVLRAEELCEGSGQLFRLPVVVGLDGLAYCAVLVAGEGHQPLHIPRQILPEQWGVGLGTAQFCIGDELAEVGVSLAVAH